MFDYGTVLLVAVLYVTTLACVCAVKPEGRARRIYVNSFVLYAILLALFKFLPESGEGGVRLVPFARLFGEEAVGFAILELLLSALLFLPLGFLSGMQSMLKGEANACLKAVLLGALLSLASELLQLIPMGKMFATDHLICNVLGAFLGFAFFALIARTERMQRTLRKLL